MIGNIIWYYGNDICVLVEVEIWILIFIFGFYWGFGYDYWLVDILNIFVCFVCFVVNMVLLRGKKVDIFFSWLIFSLGFVGYGSGVYGFWECVWERVCEWGCVDDEIGLRIVMVLRVIWNYFC